MINKLKRIYRKLFRSQPKFKITSKQKSEIHGTDYGGWTILKDSLNKDSIVYSFGVGNDISFDESIINKYGCFVHAFDPTPRVKTWINEQIIAEKFKFIPIGISNQDGDIYFYEPLDPNHISHNAKDTGSHKKLSVPAKRLATIVNDLNHNNIDILKMDIEGFEYIVIPDVLSSGIRPKQFLIEFHHIMENYSNEETESMIKLLEENNYSLFHVSDTFSEFAFVDKNNL